MRFREQFVHVRSRWRVLAVMLTALVLTVPASASAASFTAHLKAPNHSPTAGKNWRITVTATHGGAKLSGSVRYRFLYNGSVVAHHFGRKFKHGVCHDTLLFPATAVGFPLTLQVVVQTKYGTDYINWAVKVHS
jgi:hypothetical protein